MMVTRESANKSAKLALVQMRMNPDVESNLEAAVARIRDAAKQGANIVCLPEMYRSLYFPQTQDAANFDLAEPLDGPSHERMGALAKELGVVLVIPIFERRARGLYHNTALVYDADGTRVGHYRKMHIPDDPQFFEKFYFAPGDLGFRVWPTRYGRIGVLICWDQWFPEGARLTAMQGADLLVYPTAIGYHDGVDEPAYVRQQEAWETVQRGHAVANGLYVAAVNRVGKEGQLNFWGRSFVSDPFGRVMERAGGDEATILADLDYAEIERVRRGWPFLRDRRVDAYEGLTERFLDAAPNA